MKNLPFDGCCVKAKRRNFLYLFNNLGYSQACLTPFQHDREYLYLRDGFMFPTDVKIGDEIEIPVIDIVYGEPKIKEERCLTFTKEKV